MASFPGSDEGEEVNDRVLEGEASNNHWLQLSEQYTTAGFREGIITGKESSLQEGFDEGFKSGAPLGRRVGVMRGIVSSLLALSKSHSGSTQLRKHLSKISVELNDLQRPERLAKAAQEMVNTLQASWPRNSSECSVADSFGIDRIQTKLADLGSQLGVEVSPLF